jgi:hypothetical protein
MVYLLYCIYFSHEFRIPDMLSGVDDQPVFVTSINGLNAAISMINSSVPAPDVPRIMAYKRVIDAFHRDRTIIPMRYGCILEDEQKVIQLLENRSNHYASLLKELDGCVEIGIRILSTESGIGNSDPKNCIYTKNDPAFCTQKQTNSGQAYLDARKAFYDKKDRLSRHMEMAIDGIRSAVSGLYLKFKQETLSSSHGQLISLSFLVPRESVEHFCHVYGHISSEESVKLLMSGPWPPYNFV